MARLGKRDAWDRQSHRYFYAPVLRDNPGKDNFVGVGSGKWVTPVSGGKLTLLK